MAKKYRVTLTPEERVQLEQLVSRGKGAARKLAHARILLRADESAGGPEQADGPIAAALGTTTRTVERVRQRFVAQSLKSALLPKPSKRAYARKLDGEREAKPVAVACAKPPAGERRWTLRLLAGEAVELGIADPLAARGAERRADGARPGAGRAGPGGRAAAPGGRADRARDGPTQHARPGQPVRGVRARRGQAGRGEAGGPPHAEARFVAEHGGDRVERVRPGLARARRRPPGEMAAHASAWEKRRNGAAVKADWQFTTADARVKLRKLYPTIDD